MADQFPYPGMHPSGQAGGYHQFHYPGAGGDQNAQLLQGYALQHQGGPNAGAMFGNQTGGAYNFDQQNAGYTQSQSVPVCQVGPGPMQPGAGGFGYTDFPGSFNQYADMQQFGPLMTNAFGQPMPANGAILEALAHEQGLAGFNPMAFLQDPTGAASRGGGSRGSQRGGFNKARGGRVNYNLPSVSDPDGLREDTVFVSDLPQTVDHETMKTQFGVVGKIKINNKSGMPMVWIFKEKGIPKGEALVTYEDPQCVQAAIKWFSEHDFLGRKVVVKQAVNSQRPVIIPPGGGGGTSMFQNSNPMDDNFMGASGPANPAAAFAAAAVAAAASGNTMASLMNNSAAAAASLAAFTGSGGQFDGKDYPNRGGPRNVARGGGMANGRSGGSNQAGSREGDWSCAQCGNINFSWREQCNRCHVSRSQDLMPSNEMSAMPRGGMGGMPRGGGQGSIPVLSAQQPGFGRGGMMGNVGMPMAGRGIGRGGGPMRGSGIGVGRARPAPY